MELLLACIFGYFIGAGTVFGLFLFLRGESEQWQQVVGQQQERINQMARRMEPDIPEEEM